MLSYLCLLGAIIFEVSGTLLLPVSENFTKPIPTAGLTVCYLIGFFLLTFAIRSIPISIVYATWSGLGVFFVAIFGHFVYRELLPWQGVLGLAMIICGVILVNIFSQAHDRVQSRSEPDIFFEAIHHDELSIIRFLGHHHMKTVGPQVQSGKLFRFALWRARFHR